MMYTARLSVTVCLLMILHSAATRTKPADCPQLEVIFPQCDCIPAINSTNDIVIYCSRKGLTAMPTINGTYTGQIYELTLANNDIEDLPENAFQGFNIQRLDVTNNKLKNISDKAFQGLENSLIVLKISGSATSTPTVPFTAISYLVNLQELLVRDFLSPVASGDLESNMYFQPFTGLKKLTLDNLRIASIGSSVFIGLQSLTELTITNQPKLHTFPYGAIRAMRNTLEKITITVTSMSRLQQFTFQELIKLKFLDFSRNHINYSEPNCFIGMENQLEYLNLGYNTIPEIQLREVQNLTALKSLVLENIGLASLTTNSVFLHNKNNLRMLNLARNHLTTLPDNVFSTMNNLVTLELSQNSLSSMSDASLAGLTSLETLQLDSQKSSTLTLPSMSALTSLRTLVLDSTKLSTSSWDKLSQASSLNTLKMQKTGISNIPNLAFQRMTKLAFLDLSTNAIQNINQETFVGPRNSLKTIYLTSNNIATFDHCILQDYSVNVTLDLMSNPLRCDCSLLWLRNAYHAKQIFLSQMEMCAYPPALYGRYFITINASEFCNSIPSTPPCPDYYSTTTSTTTPTTTPRIVIPINVVATSISSNSITIVWTIATPGDVSYVIVVHTDLQTANKNESRFLSPIPNDYTIMGLESGRPYQICVNAYQSNSVRVGSKCVRYETLSLATTPDPNPGVTAPISNRNDIGIIIGSVVGGLLLLAILVAIIYLMVIRKQPPTDKEAVQPRGYSQAARPSVGFDSKRYRKKKKDETDGNKNNVNVTVISDGGKSGPNIGRISAGSYQYLQDDKRVSGEPRPSYVNDAAAKQAFSPYENDQSLRPLPKQPSEFSGYYNPSFKNSSTNQEPHFYSEIKL